MAHDLLQLCLLVRGGKWGPAEVAWDDLAADLRAHFAFEEHECFPVLEGSTGEGPSLVRRLRLQHTRIRSKLAPLAADFTRRAILPESIDALRETLRTHAQLESDFFYPHISGLGHRPHVN